MKKKKNKFYWLIRKKKKNAMKFRKIVISYSRALVFKVFELYSIIQFLNKIR